MRRKVVVRDEETGELVETWAECGAARGTRGHSAPGRGPGSSRPDMGARVPVRQVRTLPRGEHVYFVQARDDHGPIKIGCTKNLPSRIASLQTGSADRLTLLGYIEGYKYTEGLLHGIFAADRMHGEWFQCSERLLALAAGDLVLTINGDLKPPKKRAS